MLNLFRAQAFYKPTWRSRLIFVLESSFLIGVLLLNNRFNNFIKTYLHVPEKFLQALAFFLISGLIINFSRLAILQFYVQGNQRVGLRSNFVLGINRIASLLFYVMIFLTSLLLFEVDVRQLFTSLSIVAAALAITLKDYINNVINGLIIMFADQISLNDYIEIDQLRGRIIDITLLNVHLATDDDELIYIPNTTVLNANIINYTKRAIKKINFEFEIAYPYIHDVKHLEQFLIAAIETEPRYRAYIEPNSYNLKTVQIYKDHALLRFQYNSQSTDRDIEIKIRRRIARKLIEYIHRQSQ
ncbi:mechanosensitive ion channel family protein [Eisenibacter elegans]|jgi:small-conductance mechanosensitive channel|uniref:mechanosensitive ion channel family protein n=1 Tax=Eisenibacter elegans TaxID=997 RepID=UPI0004115ECF|nr:mechanosensitive ion channel domain-containing protein [Eisenibacter elegans]